MRAQDGYSRHAFAFICLFAIVSMNAVRYCTVLYCTVLDVTLRGIGSPCLILPLSLSSTPRIFILLTPPTTHAICKLICF